MDRVRLDGVVTLVDAKHATQHIDEVKPDGIVNEAVEQIAYADRIILNKVKVIYLLSYSAKRLYIYCSESQRLVELNRSRLSSLQIHREQHFRVHWIGFSKCV